MDEIEILTLIVCCGFLITWFAMKEMYNKL